MIRFGFALWVVLSFAPASHAGLASTCLKVLQAAFVPQQGLPKARIELEEEIREFESDRSVGQEALDLLSDSESERSAALWQMIKRDRVTQWEMVALAHLANFKYDRETFSLALHRQPAFEATMLFWAHIRQALEGTDATKLNAIRLLTSHGRLRAQVPVAIASLIQNMDIPATEVLEREIHKEPSNKVQLELELELALARAAFFGRGTYRYL